MYDDIVIGAGSAGAVIAARLSEDPERQVLLIEAGPDYSRIEDLPDDLVKPWISWVDHDWGFRGTARQGRDFPMYRGKVMGGTSAINGAIALRGVPADFDAWVELGCDQWSYEDVLPWYRKLESDPEGGDFHGTNGPVPIERSPKDAWQPTHRAFYDACREQGFDDVWDHNRPEATGVGPWPRNKRDGLRISTNIAYLMNIRDRKNLTIRHGVMVDRVRLEHGRATGVVLADGSVVEARRVCISAGAIVTPAILLRSGIGPAEKLAPHGIEQLNALPGVGENLTDHVAIGVGANAKPGVTHDSDVVFEVGLRYTVPGSDLFNDMQIGLWTTWDREHVRGFENAPGTVPNINCFAMLERPYSRGSLRLRSADPAEQPEIEMNYASHPEDLRRLMQAARLSWEILNSEPFRPYVEEVITPHPEVFESDRALADYVLAALSTTWHITGTARMGQATDPLAVTDQQGRVHGVDGLRVADTSLQPDIVSCNTNITSIMCGERISDFMRSE